MSAHANVVRDLLAMLGYDHATVVGQSFGGGVAMQFAYQYPERCERLALVASGGLGPEVNPLLRGLSVPGMDQLFPLVCSPWLRDAGARLAGLATRLGLRAGPPSRRSGAATPRSPRPMRGVRSSARWPR